MVKIRKEPDMPAPNISWIRRPEPKAGRLKSAAGSSGRSIRRQDS
jgi:hypothetical protein